MSTHVLMLLAVGLVLLGFEIFVPGAILGLAGGLLLLIGVGLAFHTGGLAAGFQALAVSLVAIGALLWFEFRVLPRTRFGRRMFLDGAVQGASQPVIADQGVIGREAVAATPLAPTGLVVIDGRRYEARCDSGFAAEGARLRVVRVETFQLVVIASD